MSKFHFFFFVALFFSLSTFLIAQEKTEKSEEIIQRETKLTEQILNDTESLKLPENRAVVFAQIGGYLCNSDEKRAIVFFQKSINDLILAQQEAEKIKKNNYAFDQLIYGQNPRFTIVQTIAACDPESALELFYKSRPAKISQMILQAAQVPGAFSNKKYYADSEIQNEQRFLNLVAEKNPERAVKILRESLKNGVSYETLNLLNKIFAKDPKTANKLAEEVVEKLLGDTLTTTDYQTNSTIQYFLQQLGSEKNPDQKSLEIPDSLLRSLADKISAFWIESNNFNYSPQSSGFNVIEKYFPARAAKLKQKQVQSGNQEYEEYNKLVQPNVSPEEMLKQADKFQSYRSSIYSSAAQKFGQNGNISEAVNIINSKFSEDEAEQQLSNFYNNLAYQEISKNNYEQANNYINQIPQDQSRFSGLLNLASAIYQNNKDENKQWALSILNQAYGLIETSEITQQEISELTQIANYYAAIEPAQAFRILESIVPTINEFTRAYAVVSQFRSEQTQRNGEFYIINNGGMLGAYNLGNIFQILKDKDFDRTMQLINSFERSETRIALKLEIVRGFSGLPMGTRFSSFQMKRGG
jgi:hypothetical protein